MFGCWINPPSGLQLVDLPQPLQPGTVQQLPFGRFAVVHHRDKRDVTVDWVKTEALSLKVVHGVIVAGFGHAKQGERLSLSGLPAPGLYPRQDRCTRHRCHDRLPLPDCLALLVDQPDPRGKIERGRLFGALVIVGQ